MEDGTLLAFLKSGNMELMKRYSQMPFKPCVHDLFSKQNKQLFVDDTCTNFTSHDKKDNGTQLRTLMGGGCQTAQILEENYLDIRFERREFFCSMHNEVNLCHCSSTAQNIILKRKC